MRKGKKTVRVEVPNSLHRRIKIKAAMTGKPMAVVCREALYKWVEIQEGYYDPNAVYDTSLPREDT